MQKIRRRSRHLYEALIQRGMKKKRAAKVANSFDAYPVDDRTAQRRAAGRKGGQATARKRGGTKKNATARKATGTKKTAAARKRGGTKKNAAARKRSGTRSSTRKTRSGR